MLYLGCGDENIKNKASIGLAMDYSIIRGVRDGSLMLCMNRNKDSRGRCYVCNEVCLPPNQPPSVLADLFF